MKKKLLYALSVFLIVYNLRAQDTWTSQTSPVGSTLTDVVYANSMYVAVGNSSVIITSTNGTSWTSRTSGATSTLQSVTYGNGKFVVGGTADICTSTDGVTWSSATTTAIFGSALPILAMEYLNGQFVGVGANGAIITSPNGTTWTIRSQNIPGSHFRGVAYGSGKYCAVGQGGIIYTSPDAVTWTQQTSNTTNVLYTITYNLGKFVVGGAIPSAILTSPDGANWTSNTTPTTNSVFGSTSTANKYITVGQAGSIMTSSDGTTWTVIASPLPPSTPSLRSVTFSGSQFVAVGDTGQIFTAPLSPTISTSGTTTAFSTCAGTASASQSFTVNGAALTANLTVTAPTGFEVSTSSGSGYGSSVSLTPTSGTVGNTTIFTRITTAATGTPSGNIVCSSTGATSGNIAVSGTVNTLPTAYSVTGTASYCIGGSGVAVGLSDSETGVNYQLKNGVTNVGSAVAGTGSAISFGSQTTAATYTVVATKTLGGCTATMTGSAVVTITSLPTTPTVSFTAATCSADGTASIDNYSAALTYASTPAGATVGALGAITGTPGTAYTFIATNALTCASADSAAVTIPVQLAAPAISIVSNSICVNATSALSPTTGGTWASSNNAIATVTNAGVVTGVSNGTATFTFTDTATSCTATTAAITIKALPVVSITGSNSICVNSTSVLSPTTGGTWVSSDNAIATVTNAGVVTGVADGTATFTFTDAATSCTATTAAITINSNVSLTIATAQTDVSCNGGTNGSASVIVSGATGALTYLWSPTGENTAIATNLAAGSYSCTITEAGSCAIIRNFTITEPDAFHITATQLGYDYNSLYSQNIVVTGGTGIKTFTLTSGNLPSGFSLSPNGEISGISTQITNSNFAVTVTDANNCSALYNIELKLNQIPVTVTATASQTKIYGESDPVLTYTVMPSLLPGDNFSGNLTRAVGENTGNYAINQGSLSAGAKYLITYIGATFAITPKPIIITANASQTKVYGTTDPIFTYSVSPNLINGDTFTGTLTRVAGENVGMYAITQGTLSAGVNYVGDYVGDNFSITKADQIISWNQTLQFGCDGETTIILTASSNSGLDVSYVSSDTNLVTISNGSLIFKNYGFATVTASQAGDDNYNPAPEVKLPVVNSESNLIRKHFDNIIFFDNSSKNFKSYSWYKNGILDPNQTNQYYKENGALNGTYYAIATKLNGAKVTTCPLTFTPTVEDEYIKVVPNPVKSNSNYQLVTNVSLTKLQDAHIQVYSISGSLIEDKITSENTVTLKAPTAEGLYVVKMTLANGKYFTKVLLVKD